MIHIENNCVGCTALGLRCIGRGCPNREVEVHRCDKCGDEVDPGDLYEIDGEDICYDCRLELLADEESEEIPECCV